MEPSEFGRLSDRAENTYVQADRRIVNMLN